jgi:hypothetical protein
MKRTEWIHTKQSVILLWGNHIDQSRKNVFICRHLPRPMLQLCNVLRINTNCTLKNHLIPLPGRKRWAECGNSLSRCNAFAIRGQSHPHRTRQGDNGLEINKINKTSSDIFSIVNNNMRLHTMVSAKHNHEGIRFNLLDDDRIVHNSEANEKQI